jgi:hypothetical protein
VNAGYSSRSIGPLSSCTACARARTRRSPVADAASGSTLTVGARVVNRSRRDTSRIVLSLKIDSNHPTGATARFRTPAASENFLLRPGNTIATAIYSERDGFAVCELTAAFHTDGRAPTVDLSASARASPGGGPGSEGVPRHGSESSGDVSRHPRNTTNMLACSGLANALLIDCYGNGRKPPSVRFGRRGAQSPQTRMNTGSTATPQSDGSGRDGPIPNKLPSRRGRDVRGVGDEAGGYASRMNRRVAE